MNWEFQKRIAVSAFGTENGRQVFQYQEFGEKQEKAAKDLYSLWQIKYPHCDVAMNKENRRIRSKKGEFYVSSDGEYAVSVSDDGWYYTLPSSTMADMSITKYLNKIFDEENR